jgi:Family of unknown function (DUF6524)
VISLPRPSLGGLDMLGWSLRFAAVLVLVLVTWNPEGRSLVHWVGAEWEDGITPPMAFTAVLLTIGWVAAFVASWRSLGVIGTGLLAALVGTGLWWVVDSSGTTLSGRAISYLVLLSIAFVLASAMSWKTFRSAIARRFRRSSAEDAEPAREPGPASHPESPPEAAENTGRP